MQLLEHLDLSTRISVIGDAPQQGFADSTFHTERLTRLLISPFNYVTYRAFIMSDGACYIGHSFEDEGRA